MDYEYFDCQIGDGIARVDLLGSSLPPAQDAADEFLDLILRLQEDRAVRVILLEDRERPFSFGADRGQLAEERCRSVQAESLTVDLEVARKVVTALQELAKPVIAAAGGVVAGDGLGFYLAADVRLARETATFAPPPLSEGLMPDWGLTFTLPRLVGPGRMLELLWSGRTLSAAEALAMGLVDRLIPADTWEEAVSAFARRVADLPQPAVHLTKLASQQFSQFDLTSMLSYEYEAQQQCWNGQETGEALLASLERRLPDYALPDQQED